MGNLPLLSKKIARIGENPRSAFYFSCRQLPVTITNYRSTVAVVLKYFFVRYVFMEADKIQYLYIL
jgi:hypothetical protein